jgi:hypothetical protein
MMKSLRASVYVVLDEYARGSVTTVSTALPAVVAIAAYL